MTQHSRPLSSKHDFLSDVSKSAMGLRHLTSNYLSFVSPPTSADSTVKNDFAKLNERFSHPFDVIRTAATIARQHFLIDLSAKEIYRRRLNSEILLFFASIKAKIVHEFGTQYDLHVSTRLDDQGNPIFFEYLFDFRQNFLGDLSGQVQHYHVSLVPCDQDLEHANAQLSYASGTPNFQAELNNWIDLAFDVLSTKLERKLANLDARTHYELVENHQRFELRLHNLCPALSHVL